MSEKIKLFIGMLWASPVTLACFIFYVLPLWAFKKYTYAGWDEITWVFQFDPAQPGTDWFTNFLKERWRRWGGVTLGNIVVLKEDKRFKGESKQRTVIHEKEHVKQVMKLGVFQPMLYGILYLVGRFVLKNVNGYYDNLFEIDARRKAGQLVDVVGTIQKLKAEAQSPEKK